MKNTEIYIVAVLGVLWGSLGAYTIVKMHGLHDEILTIVQESFEELLNKATSDAEMQKKLYIVGGILGQGIREGLGLQKSTGSQKFSIGNMIMGFLGKKLEGAFGGEQPQQQQQNTNIPSA